MTPVRQLQLALIRAAVARAGEPAVRYKTARGVLRAATLEAVNNQTDQARVRDGDKLVVVEAADVQVTEDELEEA